MLEAIYNTAFYAGCAGLMVVGALYSFQEKLLYYPTVPGLQRNPDLNPHGYRSPADLGMPFEDVRIRAADGVSTHAWLLTQDKAAERPTIVYFHGNAGNIGFRLPNARQMFEATGANVLLAEYRGFGKSEGSPTEAGIKRDVDAVVQWLRDSPLVDETRVVAFGRSLGGAAAVHMAAEHPDAVHALVVENTFLSVGAMVDVVLPMVAPLKGLILRMDWDNERALPAVSCPVLFLAGERDELVPHSHMRTLEARATSARFVESHRVRDGTHNDTWVKGGAPYLRALAGFISRAFGGEGAGGGAGLEGVAEAAAAQEAIPVMPTGHLAMSGSGESGESGREKAE